MMEPEPLQQVDRTYVRARGRKLSYFAGCDYFRLASHPKVLQAVRDGVANYGLNVAASRMTTGNHRLYGDLERELRVFFTAESALLLPTGYMADLAVTQALAGQFSHAVVDARAHPALVDAARLLDCPVLQFIHKDTDDLARTVRRCGAEAKVILLTDGMFSHDGSAAPLKACLDALPPDAFILVDDAHGAGVLGKNGRGTPEHEGVERERIIQTITLSKAFGTFGGVILGPADLRKRILGISHLFIGSTPLPLPLANAGLKALQVLKSDKGLKRRLRANSNYIKNALGKAGLPDANTPGPIVRVIPARKTAGAHLCAALFSAGIYPPFIRYPNGNPAGYFRFVISSEHTRQQLNRLLDVLLPFVSRMTGTRPPNVVVPADR